MQFAFLTPISTRLSLLGLRLTLVVRRACELDDEIGFCHHREFLRFASEIRHAWFNIDALN